MMRALPAIAVCLSLVAVLFAGVALSIDGPLPSPAAVPETVIVYRESVVEVTAVPSPVSTRPPTSTPLPNCEITLFQGSVCRWPTATPILPLPTCGPHDPGLTCVRRGPVQATIPRPTATATFALGVIIKEGRETS